MDKFFQGNTEWADGKLKEDPEYFRKLSKEQRPESLLVTCSDSRIPVSRIMNAGPGDLFTHRNIANSVHLNDLNFLSVLEYAVVGLRVKNIIIMGHYHCGGIKAAVKGVELPLVESWVSPIKSIYLNNLKELNTISEPEKALDRLSELNVIVQLENLAMTPVLKKKFSGNNYPELHGWIFDIYSGKIKKLELPFSRWIDGGIIPVDYKFRS